MQIILVLLFLVFTGGAWANDPLCSEAEPKTRYAGPLFDAMAQIESGQSDIVTASMEKSGIYRMALFPRRAKNSNGESDVLSLKKRFSQRFVIGTLKLVENGTDLSWYFVKKTLSDLDDDRYQFVGEILFVHADKTTVPQTLTGEEYIAPTGKNVIKLLTALENRNIPIMAHWEVYDWNRDWPGFHDLFTRFPKVTFIWPHAGFASPEQVRIVLASHANVVITLSKEEKNQDGFISKEKSDKLGGAVVDLCGKLIPQWRDLFEKYPDRFMFATDAHNSSRWANYAHIVKQWRFILGQLPDPVAQALAWRNAERVYGAPR